MKTTCFLLSTLCASRVYASGSLRLYHRIWDPSSPPPSFSLRASIQSTLQSEPTLVSPDSAGQLVLNPDQLATSIYQVALERDGDLSESEWDLSSVKVCHLAGMESDLINLHLSASGYVYAVDYFVRPVPHDGACPNTIPGSRINLSFTNTTLTLHASGIPPLPELRAPPPLSPKGEPIQPQPEQSFIQKYWMYIALGLVTLVLTGGGAPDEEREGQGGQAQGKTSGVRADGR